MKEQVLETQTEMKELFHLNIWSKPWNSHGDVDGDLFYFFVD